MNGVWGIWAPTNRHRFPQNGRNKGHFAFGKGAACGSVLVWGSVIFHAAIPLC